MADSIPCELVVAVPVGLGLVGRMHRLDRESILLPVVGHENLVHRDFVALAVRTAVRRVEHDWSRSSCLAEENHNWVLLVGSMPLKDYEVVVVLAEHRWVDSIRNPLSVVGEGLAISKSPDREARAIREPYR